MRISDWSSDVCSSDLQIAQGAEAGKDALDVGIEVGEKAVRLGGVGGTARTTGSRGRRVGGHVELGRVELAGRGIVAIGPEQITPSSAFYRAAGIIITVAVHQRRSEEHTSELQSLMRNSYAVFCLKKKKQV